jgi:hypothetical protein
LVCEKKIVSLSYRFSKCYGIDKLPAFLSYGILDDTLRCGVNQIADEHKKLSIRLIAKRVIKLP